MLEKVLRGTERRPRRVLLYGTHGIGKSTWAAKAWKPLFLATEDGQGDIGCDRTPPLKNLAAVNSWISDLVQQEHDYQTVVIDTLDWLERLIHEHVAIAANKPSIEDIPYGKGYVFAVQHWDFLLKSLEHLRTSRRMAVILLAHAKITAFRSPDADTYDRYEPDLHKNVSPMLQEWCDEVLFATYKVGTVQRSEGFNRTRTRAVGKCDRIVLTSEGPTHLAKRRIWLPDEMQLNFDEYKHYVTPGEPTINADGNIQGIVANGSSKPQPEESVNG